MAGGAARGHAHDHQLLASRSRARTSSRVEDVGGGLKRELAPRKYSTFSPIVAVGLKLDTLLPRTLISRSLLIRMTPARVGEVPEEIIGNRAAVARLHTLAGRIKRWVADNETALCIADRRCRRG